jgi:hypothetical protein
MIKQSRGKIDITGQSFHLLGYGRSEETMMRLESANIAGELMKSLG